MIFDIIETDKEIILREVQYGDSWDIALLMALVFPTTYVRVGCADGYENALIWERN